MLVVIACVALCLWAWPVWLHYRTAQSLRSLGSLSNKDTAAHQRACDAVLSIGGGRASVPPLVEALRSDDSGMRYTAAMAVGAIGPDAAEAIPALIVLLDEPNLYVRQVAPRALGAIGSAAKPALPALCRALRDKEWLIRTGAAEAIFKVEPRVVAECAVVPTLEELLEHPDPMARGEAKRILGELWRSGHVEPPNPALQRTRPAVPAGHATSSLGGPVR